MDTEEANDTHKHTGKGVFLYSEPSDTTMAQGPHREHRRRAETEYPLKDPAQQGELMLRVDRACEFLTNDSAIASRRSNFKC